MTAARARWIAAVATAVAMSAAGAEDEAGPDPDLLEYLGSWQDSDEEWLAVVEWETPEAGAEPPPEPEADGKTDE